MTGGNFGGDETAGVRYLRALSDSHVPLRRLCYSLAFATIPLALTACSYLTDLVVRNYSDQAIVVTLTPVSGGPGAPSSEWAFGFVYEALGVAATTDEHEFKSVEWTQPEASGFRYDSTGSEVRVSVSVVVPPKSSFRVGRGGAAGSKLLLDDGSTMTLEIEAAGLRQRLSARDLRDKFRPVLHRAVYAYDVGR